ncbi:uncharacterized protein LOC108666534 [Hyalella azteca]|uniref:Uncharacterized protein LOC108666534 n=1 Tax=Hyalella azteca TaxID=294128 RepID=A0A8B7N6M3_HYAAZ|nr:uncharacterized protein LOC108666534 [Hyalella azteca]
MDTKKKVHNIKNEKFCSDRTLNCLRITFSKDFSIKQELSFIDYIADSSNILFKKELYAVCKDVETAVALAEKLKHCKALSRLIKKVVRLGPAASAFTSRLNDPTVLTIRKLAEGITHQELAVRFPEADDICIKTTMAKLKFDSIKTCKKVYREFNQIVWPGDEKPSVKEMDFNSPLVKGQPHPKSSKFSLDPTVVHLILTTDFSLKNHCALLDQLTTASDIILSQECRVTFSDARDVLKRMEILKDVSVMGEKLSLVPFLGSLGKVDKKRPCTEMEGASTNDLKQTSKSKKSKTVSSAGKKLQQARTVAAV